MQLTNCTRWYARRTRLQALAILALTITGMVVSCIITASAEDTILDTASKSDRHDLRLYRAIVQRVHSGEDYYDAAQSELRTRGYPTRSMFNWRTPLYAWMLGSLPQPVWGKALLGLFALAAVLVGYGAVRRQGCLGLALVSALFLFLAFAPYTVANTYLFTEFWAGTLITLSVCAYASDRWVLGVAAGLLALFIRELTLPYCVVAFALACWRGRRREIVVWIAGFALYGLYLGFHGMEVANRITCIDIGQKEGWMQFGGLPFLLQTAQMNALLVLAPSWVTGVAFPLALLGLAGWPGELGLRARLALLVYLAAFAIVGQPFNDYWGWMYTPLLVFGFVATPVALWDLLRAILRRAPKPTVNSPLPRLQPG